MRERIRIIHKALASLQAIHGAGDLDAGELNSAVAFITLQLAMIESEIDAGVRVLALTTLGQIGTAARAVRPAPSFTTIEGGKS